MCVCVCVCVVNSIVSNIFFFGQALKILVEFWKFSILLLYILRDDWPTVMISGLQQELENTPLKPDCHSW